MSTSSRLQRRTVSRRAQISAAVWGRINISENTIDGKGAECCCRTKVRSEKEQRDLINRLSRIEGQVRGIRRMLEEDAYCIDIINQVAAANAALNSFTKVMLANHIHTCVTEDVQAGNSEKVDELVKTLQKLMK